MTDGGPWDNVYTNNILPKSGSFVDLTARVQIGESGVSKDTQNYAVFGVTRSADAANNSYIGLTRQENIAWAMGIDANNSMISGLSTQGRVISFPYMLLNTSGQLWLSVSGSNGGIKIGDDTNLYRESANVLKTDDLFVAGQGLATTGGTSGVPGLWFNSFGPAGYFGGALGIGLNQAGQIVLNAGNGGVVTANAGSLKNTLDDGSGNMTVAGQLQLPSSSGIITNGKVEMACTSPSYRWSNMAEYQANFEKYLWKLEWNGSQWNWTADSYIMPLGNSFIRLKDSSTADKYVDIGIIQTETALEDRTLWVSNHLIVKKDFACGGAASVMQGALVLGSDWDALNSKSQQPQILLSHSEGSPYPDNPKRDILHIWRANHVGLASVKLSTLYAQQSDQWPTHSIQAFEYYLYYNNDSGTGGFVPGGDSLMLGGPDVGGYTAPMPWRHIYGRWIHAYDQFGCSNKTIGNYDSKDDLVLVKGLKSKSVTNVKYIKNPVSGKEETRESQEEVIDFSGLDFLHLDDDSLNVNALIGFLYGCTKALAKKQDEHDNALLTLLNEKEQLSQEVAKLRLELLSKPTENGVNA